MQPHPSLFVHCYIIRCWDQEEKYMQSDRSAVLVPAEQSQAFLGLASSPSHKRSTHRIVLHIDLIAGALQACCLDQSEFRC